MFIGITSLICSFALLGMGCYLLGLKIKFWQEGEARIWKLELQADHTNAVFGMVIIYFGLELLWRTVFLLITMP